MQLRTAIRFTDPGSQNVTLTLTGTLEGFEKLERALSKSDVPLYEVDTLIYQLRDLSRDLRRSFDTSVQAPRRMVEGDL